MKTASPITLSVVIPALNEEMAISGILERLLSLRTPLAAAGIDGPEVIVVDDGSRDRTGEIVSEFPDVSLIRHGENRGYGAALKTGLAHARGDLIGFVDADGTYPPELFPRLCDAALKGADVVIGSRMGGAPNGMPVTRRIGNRLFARLVTVLGPQTVGDCASGMRVVRRTVLSRLYPLPDGLNFTPVMSMRAVHEGLRLVEVPIPYHERIGRSKLSVVRDGWRYARSIVWTALGYNPVRVFGAIGLAGVAAAVLVGLGLIGLRLQGVTRLGPWGIAAIFAALVAGVSGVSLFSLGVIFNYLISLVRKERLRWGLFGRPLLTKPLERHFGWAGALLGSTGALLATVALTLGIQGWDLGRLWLYLVGSALLMLVGLQLVISWILVRKLDELTERELRWRDDS
jgi:hypothetical protein